MNLTPHTSIRSRALALFVGMLPLAFVAACGSDTKDASTGTQAASQPTQATAAPTASAAPSSDTAAPESTAAPAPGPLQKVRLQLNWLLDAEFASIFVADAQGFYKDEGIDLEILPGGPNLQAVEGIVAGGAADIGMATFLSSTVSAAAEGTDFTVLGTFFPTSPAVFLSSPDHPVASAQDMVGKKIGGPQGRQVQIDAIFKVNNLPQGDYTFVPVGFDPSPLVNGDVDVMSGYITSEGVTYEQMTGKKPHVLSYTDAGLPDYNSPLFTTPKFAKEHRDLVVGFMRATMKGIMANKADPEAGAKLAVDVYGKDLGLKLDEEIAKSKAYVGLQENESTDKNGLMFIDPAFVSGPVFTGYEAAGLKTVPVDSILDPSIQADAWKGL
jgi:ABC-type nitrate/sulfonate/bicarbonate transport system substrate-binding protein